MKSCQHQEDHGKFTCSRGYGYGEHGELPAPLFNMLDAAYPVAVMVDRLVDTLVAEDRLKLDTRWTTPALKYWVSALVSAATGGTPDTLGALGGGPPPGAPVLELDAHAWYVFAETAEQVCGDCGVQGLLFKKFLAAIEGALRGPKFLAKSHSVPALSCLQPVATDTDGVDSTTPEAGNTLVENDVKSTHNPNGLLEALDGAPSGARSGLLQPSTSNLAQAGTAGAKPRRGRGRGRGGLGRDPGRSAPAHAFTVPARLGPPEVNGDEEVEVPVTIPPTPGPDVLANVEDTGSRPSSAPSSTGATKGRRWGARRA